MSAPSNPRRKRIVSEPVQNLPGFDLTNKLISAFSRGLSQQASVHNQNWIKLRAGELTFSELLASIGDIWQANHDTLMSLLVAPFPRDNVQWINFVVELSAKGLNVPGPQRVELPSKAINDAAPLKVVGMHVLGKPLENHMYLDVDSTLTVQRDHGSVKVEINGAGLHEQIVEWGVSWESGQTADYLAMVFDGPSASARPALIVTLRIVCIKDASKAEIGKSKPPPPEG